MGFGFPAPYVETLSFSGSSATAGTTTWSDAIRIPAGFQGIFNLKWELNSGGTITWVYSIAEQYSGNYVIPTGTSKIATSATTATGESADGKDSASFSPPAAPYIKIGAVETGGVRTMSVSGAWLIIA